VTGDLRNYRLLSFETNRPSYDDEFRRMIERGTKAWSELVGGVAGRECLNISVLLDTSFLISFVNENRPNHGIATQYYCFMVEQRVPMYFSAIVAAEFAIKQSITDLPLRNFRDLQFNIPHGVKTAF
jgi:hypothetical protein